MKNLLDNRLLYLLVFLTVGFFIFRPVSLAQEKSDEELKKEYAAILGEYEFDLSDMGGNVEILKFYVEDGALWADSGDERPATMEPMGDEDFKFRAEDPESGIFEFEFLQDDLGEYTICHLVNSNMGLDITGTKIK
jgi:hypothetical protein